MWKKNSSDHIAKIRKDEIFTYEMNENTLKQNSFLKTWIDE